jgi:hypothetical protein
MQDARNLIRHCRMRPDLDWLHFRLRLELRTRRIPPTALKFPKAVLLAAV